MPRLSNKDELIEFMENHYKRHFKAAYYLLFAHGSGLLTCVTGLKEYASTPQLNGVGAFVVLFGLGFLSSIVYYVSVFLARAVVLNALMSDEDPNDSVSAGFLKLLNLIFLTVAIGALIGYRFGDLAICLSLIPPDGAMGERIL
jgi:hypothetical protein